MIETCLLLFVLAPPPVSAPDRTAVYQTGAEFIVPELIIGGEWTSTIRLTNKGSGSIPRSNVWLIDDEGRPMTATFQVTNGDVITDSGFAFWLQGGDIIEVTFKGTGETRFGHARIDSAACPQTSPCSLYGEVTLRNHNPSRPDLEAVFPLEAASDVQYLLYDHRDGFWTVLYLVSDNNSPTNVTLEFRDYAEKVLGTHTLTLNAGAATILRPHVIVPQTLGTFGTLIIRGRNSQGATPLIVATGLRVNPTNSFTPIRAFAPKK